MDHPGLTRFLDRASRTLELIIKDLGVAGAILLVLVLATAPIACTSVGDYLDDAAPGIRAQVMQLAAAYMLAPDEAAQQAVLEEAKVTVLATAFAGKGAGELLDVDPDPTWMAFAQQSLAARDVPPHELAFKVDLYARLLTMLFGIVEVQASEGASAATLPPATGAGPGAGDGG